MKDKRKGDVTLKQRSESEKDAMLLDLKTEEDRKPKNADGL